MSHWVGDCKQTVLDLRRFPAAKTIVMSCPPRMSGEPPTTGHTRVTVEVPAQPQRAARAKETRIAAPLPLSSVPPPPWQGVSTAEVVRGPQNYGPLLPVTSEPLLLVKKRRSLGPSKPRYKLMALGALAVVALVLVLPVSLPTIHLPESSHAANAEARNAKELHKLTASNTKQRGNETQTNNETQLGTKSETQTNNETQLGTKNEEPKAQANEALPAEQADTVVQRPVPAADEPSIEKAAALLLSGHRAHALVMYQALAASRQSSPGIEAMVIVLSQKVPTL